MMRDTEMGQRLEQKGFYYDISECLIDKGKTVYEKKITIIPSRENILLLSIHIKEKK